MIKTYEYKSFQHQLQVEGYVPNWLKISDIYVTIVPNVRKHYEQMWDVKVSSFKNSNFLSTDEVDALLLSLSNCDFDLALSKLDELSDNLKFLSSIDRNFMYVLGNYLYESEVRKVLDGCANLSLRMIEGAIAI